MRYRKIILQIAALAVCAVVLAGCGEEQAGQSGSETAGVPGTEAAAVESSTGQPEGSAVESSENLSESGMSQVSPEQAKLIVPTLPATGRELSDFVIEGWELMDSVELDYNEDGIMDCVGVVTQNPELSPDRDPSLRILFAIVSDGPGQYRLDFQDENLIRKWDEGGVFGDPYEPLTAEGTSFTTHAYGGSAWKWSEAYTYTYRDGTWYLTCSEVDDGYGPYTTIYTKNDWESGIRTRKIRSDEFSDMEQHWEKYESWEDWDDDEEYDLEYEMRLDEPFTLYQAGKRWWLAPDRVTDWEVKEIMLAEGIELSQEMIRMPEQAYLNDYCDEDCVLYTFSNAGQDDEQKYYLAMYRWQDRSLTVLAEEYSAIDDKELYRDKIYYSTGVIEHIAYQSVEHGETCIKEEDCVIGMRLNRMDPDGTGKEIIFEYLYPGTDQQLLEKKPPYYMALIMDISGGEIVAEVYIGDEPHPVYRMDIDGSNLRQIGQIPRE